MIESADTTHASAAASMSISFRGSARSALRRSMSAKKGASRLVRASLTFHSFRTDSGYCPSNVRSLQMKADYRANGMSA
jgi:hypothetical protein